MPTPTAIEMARRTSMKAEEMVTKHPLLLGPKVVSTEPFKSEKRILSIDSNVMVRETQARLSCPSKFK